MKEAEKPIPEKLTKKFFLGLPKSVYVASNLLQATLQPIFAEITLPGDSRLEQWKRITAVGADQKLCRVFKNKSACDKWLGPISVKAKKP